MKLLAERHLGWWRRYNTEAADPSLSNSQLYHLHLLDTAITASRMSSFKAVELLAATTIRIEHAPDYITDPYDGRWDMLTVDNNSLRRTVPELRLVMYAADIDLQTRLNNTLVPDLHLPSDIVAARLGALHITPMEYTSASDQLWMPLSFERNPSIASPPTATTA